MGSIPLPKAFISMCFYDVIKHKAVPKAGGYDGLDESETRDIMAQKWPMCYYLFLISYEDTLILCNLILGTFDACYNLHVKRIISDNSLHAILYGNHVGFAYC